LSELRQRVAEQDAQLVRSRQAEADQRQFNSSLPVLVATAGLDGYYKEVNAAFEHILGWSEQESLARPFLDFIHPEDRAMAVETFARLKAGTPAVNFLDRNICKDGSHRWINWIVVPVPGRDIVFGIGQDITERKLAEDDRERAQEAIRQSEQRMRLHVQQTPLAVIEWDVNRRVTHWNPGAERIFGYTEQEALGIHYSVVTPLESREHVERVWSALFVKKGGERSTNENVTKDGRSILCEWYNTPLVNAEGQVIGVASLAEDITDRKRAEQQLQEANERLERRIEERTAELQQANELLQAELEQRRQAEEELRASKERFELVVRGAGVGIWDWDIRTGKMYYSPRWKMLFGYEENEIGDGFDDWTMLLHPDERDRFVKFQEDFLAGTSSNLPPSTVCATKTDSTAGSRGTASLFVTNKERRFDSSVRTGTSRTANWWKKN
jgi:PAS domain S-box-containing protein